MFPLRLGPNYLMFIALYMKQVEQKVGHFAFLVRNFTKY